MKFKKTNETISFAITLLGLLAGLWEFPSVKVEDESDETVGHTIQEILQKSCGLTLLPSTQSSMVGNVSTLFISSCLESAFECCMQFFVFFTKVCCIHDLASSLVIHVLILHYISIIAYSRPLLN